LFEFRKIPGIFLFTFLYSMGAELVDSVMTHDKVLKLMKSKEKYDICVVEIFNADALLGIADHFDCILISYTTFGAVRWIDDMTSK